METKTKTIQVFDCGIEHHAHKTESGALRRIAQQEGKIRAAPHKRTKEKLKQVLTLRRSGMTFDAVGKAIDPPVSATRASELFRSAERREKYGHL